MCVGMTGCNSFPQGIPASRHALASNRAARVENVLGCPRRLARLASLARSVRMARLRLSPVTAQYSSRNLLFDVLPLSCA